MACAAEGPIYQIGHVVADLDAAIASRLRTARIGPWLVFRGVVLEGTFRATPTAVTIDVGLAWRGDTQIELIEVKSETPSPYQRADGTPLTGIHHLAWITDDLDASVAEAKARGLAEVFSAANPGARVCYLEDPVEPGFLYEFIESEATVAMTGPAVVEAAQWDGSNPVREIG
ncbi:MAG: VOC family protein [Proteobacteria bacterium]|nr:VOC family protein [Pseudomonadota bacterium]MDE2412698.1 VOC family protein [Sphingomonadales bacterium]